MVFYIVVSLIDSLIYRLVETIFKVILYLADVQVLSDGLIGDLTNKVYAFLAVLMFFKIAISTIQYIVNPEELSNSDKGIGSILKNTAIAIILLVVVPEIFKFARTQQSNIASYIPAIILDEERSSYLVWDETTQSYSTNSKEHVESVRQNASRMAWQTFNAFVTTKDGSGLAPIDHDWSKARQQNDNETQNIPGSIYYGCHKDCVELFGSKLFCIASFDDSQCTYKYNMLWSTATGILMVFVLVSMGIDIAIRAIKLSILEVMAPIPIVSYIDKAKGGSFEAWLKECKNVYIDLFIRLIIIYFIVYLIGHIVDDFADMSRGIFASMKTESFDVKALVFVFLIIGLLLFAKNAPKFICDLLGIKNSDSISGMFKRAGGLMGTALGGAKTARSNYTTQKERMLGKGKSMREAKLAALKSAAAGFMSASGRGMVMSAQGKGFNEARNESFRKAIDARNRRNDRIDNIYRQPVYDEDGNLVEGGYGWRQYRKDVRRQKLGIPDTSAFYESVNKNLTEIRASIDAQVGHGLKKLEDYKGQSFHSDKGFGEVKENGVVRMVHDMDLATARARASAEIGSFYVDSETEVNARRSAALQAQQNKVASATAEAASKESAVQRAQQQLSEAKARGEGSGVISTLEGILAKAEKARDQANEVVKAEKTKKAEMEVDVNLGKIQVTDEIRGQWDVIVHNLEKQARFTKESELLHDGDVDAVVGLEKTLQLLQTNVTLDNDTEVSKMFEDMKKAYAAQGKTMPFTSIADMLQKLQGSATVSKNGTKAYDLAPELLEAAKGMAESLVAATNQRAQVAAERAKRVSNAIQNDSKKG